MRHQHHAVTTVGHVSIGLTLADGMRGGDVNATDINKQIVLNLNQKVWREGRIDDLPLFWSIDCVNHADPAPVKEGLVALQTYHEGFVRWFLDYREIVIEVEQQIAEVDRVVTQMVLSAVHKKKQRPISLRTIRIDRLVGGRIAEHWSIADMAGLTQQLA